MWSEEESSPTIAKITMKGAKSRGRRRTEKLVFEGERGQSLVLNSKSLCLIVLLAKCVTARDPRN